MPQTEEFALPRANGIINEYIPFAVNIGANVTDIRAWAASSVVEWGFPPGSELPSGDANRAWKQSSFIAAGVAQLVGEALAISMFDDGDLPTFVQRLRQAIGNISITQAGGIPEPPPDGRPYGRQVGVSAIQAHSVSIRAADVGTWIAVLPLSGGSMDGLLFLSEHPTALSPPLQAATRYYVDTFAFPEAPTDGRLYARNGLISQWVPIQEIAPPGTVPRWDDGIHRWDDMTLRWDVLTAMAPLDQIEHLSAQVAELQAQVHELQQRSDNHALRD